MPPSPSQSTGFTTKPYAPGPSPTPCPVVPVRRHSHCGQLQPHLAQTLEQNQSVYLRHIDISESQRKKPDCCVPAGTSPASDQRGRNLRFPGSSGIGQVPVAGTVEGGLRGIHGGAGPEHPQDGAQTRSWHRASRTSIACRRNCLRRKAGLGRRGHEFRRTVAVFLPAKLVGIRSQSSSPLTSQ